MSRLAKRIVVAALWIIAGSNLWALDEKTVQSRLSQLKNMSAIERDRLNRNMALFRTLSPEQKEHYRKLHEKIAEDRRNGGSMADLLDAYTVWLSTLTPAQRDQLQAEKDAGKKQVLVRHLIEERERQEREAIETQTKEAKERVAAEDAAQNEPKKDQQPPLLPSYIHLGKRELDAIMRAIVEDLPLDQRPARGQSLPPVYEYPQLIKQSIASRKNPEDWPDDDLMKKMEQHLQGPKVGMFLQLSRMGQHGREIAASVILREIFAKTRDNLHKPTDEERQAVLDDLTPFEKRKFDQLKQSKTDLRQKEFLNQKFWEKRDTVSYGQLLECRNNILELFDQLKILPPDLFRSSYRRSTQKKSPGPKGRL